MHSYIEEEDDLFFDSYSRVGSPLSCSSPDHIFDERQDFDVRRLDSEFWIKDLKSVRERRKKFLHGTGFAEFVSCPVTEEAESIGSERVTESSGSELDSLCAPSDAWFIRDLDSGRKFLIKDLDQNGFFSMLRKLDTKEAVTLTEKHRKSRKWWKSFMTRRPFAGTCKVDVSVKDSVSTVRAKVLLNKKRSSEFNALYMGQEIKAHKGSVRTMKFSPSGCYVASGGEDCIVRIWRVMEVEASMDGLSKCGKVKNQRLMYRRKGVISAPVVFPEKVLKIDEIPLQELHGHTGEVLDLTWSDSDHLLTSSMDKTVRMWKVGCDGCLKIFQHNDYVTSVQFSPVNDNYFVSGSLDGKIRIWNTSEERVVDWDDLRDIVTAVCYRPDGEGLLVGSLSGKCRIYSWSGSTMQLDTQFCVQRKKKSSAKLITGLQFTPGDPQKIMVTSGDSTVRIFDGTDIIYKFRGCRKTKTHSFASFTADGRYIVSTGEDSHVYIWNYQQNPPSKQLKLGKSTRSCSNFFSEGVSVAIPWTGMPPKLLELGTCLFADGMMRGSSTWPEEKLPVTCMSPTWGLGIVTASHDGFIRTFHNYGLTVQP